MILHKQVRLISYIDRVRVLDVDTQEIVIDDTAQNVMRKLKAGSVYKDAFIKGEKLSIDKDKPLITIKVKRKTEALSCAN